MLHSTILFSVASFYFIVSHLFLQFYFGLHEVIYSMQCCCILFSLFYHVLMCYAASSLMFQYILAYKHTGNFILHSTDGQGRHV